MLIILALSALLIAQTKAQGQQIVTDVNCEITDHSRPEWQYTKYGPNGGQNGGYHGGIAGRLFEFDCQTDYCYDTEGERGEYWQSCGYSWRTISEVEKHDRMVLVDVRTQAENTFKTKCDDGYEIVGHWDATGWDAKDTDGQYGHHSFQICIKRERLSYAKENGLRIVSNLYASTSSKAPASGYSRIGQWDTHDGGRARAYGNNKHTGDWMYLYVLKEFPQTYFTESIGWWKNFDSDDSFKSSSSSIVYQSTFDRTNTQTSEEEQLESFTSETSISQTIGVESGVEMEKAEFSEKYEMTVTSTLSATVESRVMHSIQDMVKNGELYKRTVTVPAGPWVLYTWAVYRKSNIGFGAELTSKRTIVKSGNCRDIPPNCVPGYCRDADCFTCDSDEAIIDRDFRPPARCASGRRLLAMEH